MPANSFCTDESVHQMMDSSYYRGWGKTFEIIKQRAINSPTTPNHFNYMSDYNSGSGCKKELTAGQLLRASSMFYSTRLAVLKTLQNKLSVDELLDWSMGDIDTSDRAKHWVNS